MVCLLYVKYQIKGMSALSKVSGKGYDLIYVRYQTKGTLCKVSDEGYLLQSIRYIPFRYQIKGMFAL